jgi:LPXTG-motif cell wall-anchored protein
VCQAHGRTEGGLERPVMSERWLLVRRALIAFSTGALFVVVWASSAWGQSTYPPTPAGGGGEQVPGVVSQPSAGGTLPRTGASNTPSLVLIGVAALVVGLVLVLAVRRRRALARGIA